MRATCSTAAFHSSPSRIAHDLPIAQFAGDGTQDLTKLVPDSVLLDDDLLQSGLSFGGPCTCSVV